MATKTLKKAGIVGFNKTDFFLQVVDRNEGVSAKEVADALEKKESKAKVKRPTSRVYVYAILGRLQNEKRVIHRKGLYFPSKKAA